MADTAPSVPGFFDGLGDRLVVTDRSARALEVLRLRQELVADPRFEAAVRARAAQLAQFQHAGCSHVRHVGRLPGGDGRLALVSDFVTGWRLSEVLQAAEQLNLTLHTNAALFLLRQLVSAVSDLHALGPDVSHGALGPERIVITPTGRLVVTEHVLGSALPFVPSISPQRAWRDLRLAVPADEAQPFGQRSDVLQVGLCGLALVLSRPLRLDDYPQRLRDLLDRASESKLTGERRPVRPALRGWLEQVLGLVPDAAVTAHDVREALGRLLSREGYLATPTGLVGLLQSVEAYFAGDVAPAPPASGAQAPVVEPQQVVPEPKPVDAVPPDLAASEPPQTVVATPGTLSSGHLEETRAERVVEERAPWAPRGSAGHDAPHAHTSWSAPARAEHEATPVADPERETVLWEETSRQPLAASVEPEPPVDASTPLETEPGHAGNAVVASMDPDGLDLAPGPRPAWPAPPEPTAEADSFAPEPGIAFTPDEPAAQDWQDVPAAAPALGATAVRDPGLPEAPGSGRHELPWLRTPPPSGPQETMRVRRSGSGSFEVAPPPPVPRPSGAEALEQAELMVGPIAATVEEEVSERAAFGRDRSHSGPVRAAGSLFGSSHHEGEGEGAPSPRFSRTRWIAAAAIGCLALAGTLGGWALMGTSAEEPAGGKQAAVSGPSEAGSERGARPAQEPRAAEPSDRSSPNNAAPAPPAVEVPAVPTGQLRVIAPFPVEVFEGGAKIGTSAAPIELTAGRHRLELVNEELKFRSPETVDVRADGRARVQPAIPNGTANINAIPWAEVWIDGQDSGETPLGNLTLPIGSHLVVFKHPQLGEQTRTMVVTTAAAARLSVEMKQ